MQNINGRLKIRLRRHRLGASILGILFFVSCTQPKLIGHWKLQGDSRDYSGMGNDGINHGVDLSSGAEGRFSGDSAYIEIGDNERLRLDKDFSISAWVRVDAGARVGGDIVNKFDVDTRKGVNFHILSSSSAYNGPSDVRNLFFGIDDARDGEWIDCGRPLATNNLVSAFLVHDNQLYAMMTGATDPGKAMAMYRYEGDGKWKDCGRPSNDPNTQSIMSAVVYNGQIYVGTGKWDYVEQQTAGTAAGVYRYLGGTSWEPYGKFPPGKKRIHSISIYKGTLYANDDQGEVYSYDTNSANWKLEFKKQTYKFISSSVFGDDLYYGSDSTIFRLDKNGHWDTVGNFNSRNISQTHTFETYQGQLYAGTWPNGYIMRYAGDTSWVNCGWLGTDDATLAKQEAARAGLPVHRNEIQELIVYNGKMYAGVIPKGEVWRYDGGQKNKLIKRLVNNPYYSISEHNTWCRVPSMAIYQGRLYAGTGTARAFPADTQHIETGKVYSWQTGQAVSYDKDLGTEWRHVTAVREKDQMKLYVDGKQVSSSVLNKSPDFSLSNNRPLMIGFGTQNYFKGSMKDVRIYSGALSGSSIEKMYNESK
ncbi:MAG: LamG-like jellyroll fold domain-containing protein [Ferruginibacter sp.]